MYLRWNIYNTIYTYLIIQSISWCLITKKFIYQINWYIISQRFTSDIYFFKMIEVYFFIWNLLFNGGKYHSIAIVPKTQKSLNLMRLLWMKILEKDIETKKSYLDLWRTITTAERMSHWPLWSDGNRFSSHSFAYVHCFWFVLSILIFCCNLLPFCFSHNIL